MRVESCGPLFVEPKEGDVIFDSFASYHHRLSEPISAFINPKISLKEEQENEQEQEQPLGVPNFFLLEEEWSPFNANNKEQPECVIATASATSATTEEMENNASDNITANPSAPISSSSDLQSIQEQNNNNDAIQDQPQNRFVSSSEEYQNQVNNEDILLLSSYWNPIKDPSTPSGFSWNGGAPLSFGGIGNPNPHSLPVDSHPDPITSASTAHGHFHNLNNRKQTEQEQGLGYFEDWQNQSVFLSYEVEKAKMKWAQNLYQPKHQNNFDANANVVMNKNLKRGDELEKAFLSKFDDRVAAIWGGGRRVDEEHATFPHPSASCGVAFPTATFPSYTCPDPYLSTSSTPISGAMYPWSSPTILEQRAYNGGYDLPTLQGQVNTKRPMLDDDDGQFDCFQGESLDFSDPIPPLPILDSSRPTTPSSTGLLSDMILQNFGPPPLEYHLFKEGQGVHSSLEEREQSLHQLNHEDGSAGFKRFVPEILCWIQASSEELSKSSSSSSLEEDREINEMQQILGGLELDSRDSDRSGVDGFNSEVSEILKSKPKTMWEQQFGPTDLFYSWNTHFTPVEIREKRMKGGGGGKMYPSPPGILTGNESNLPEYQWTRKSEDKAYNHFPHPAKTLFPIRFRVVKDTSRDKGIQTDVDPPFPSPDPFQHSTAFDFNSLYEDPCVTPFTSLSSLDDGSGTMNLIPFDNPLDIQLPLDFYLNGASGYDTGRGWNRAVGEDPYQCCDSGIGVDSNASRVGYYEDVLQDLDDFEAGFFTNNDPGELDWSHTQHQPWNGPRAPGTGVGGNGQNRGRRKHKSKPCKYFLAEGICKKGKNCKFSHDLQVCRYWAEGTCLKGENCKYLHCFVDQNVEGYPAMRQRQLNLESENDFPSLGFGANQGSNMLSSRDYDPLMKFRWNNNSVVTPLDPFSSYLPSSGSSSVVPSSSSSSLLMLADPAGSGFVQYSGRGNNNKRHHQGQGGVAVSNEIGMRDTVFTKSDHSRHPHPSGGSWVVTNKEKRKKSKKH